MGVRAATPDALLQPWTHRTAEQPAQQSVSGGLGDGRWTWAVVVAQRRVVPQAIDMAGAVRQLVASDPPRPQPWPAAL